MRLALAALVWLSAALAAAEVLPPDVRDGVAAAIFDRAIRLYHEGKTADARTLFAEAAAASPEGPYAETARTMVARAEARLARKKVAPPPPGPETAPIDPYADATVIEVRSPSKPAAKVVMPALPPTSQPVKTTTPEPLDPYADLGPAAPLDPYADAPSAGQPLDPYADPQPPPRPAPKPKKDQPLDPYGELE